MFLEKRVYQGSSGEVYPFPVIDQVADRPEPAHWRAVFLENAYLKIMILPELGGRVQMALDKTNDYHFIYYNRVIKPALVGLAGPWIAGGLEFNWPQHHRPSTFSPVQWQIIENEDGSQTVWLNEIDRMYRTKGMHGLRLYPDRAYMEVDVRLYNRTDQPQTFLWWANPGIHVDEHHQSVFPPDVHAVMDHGKRDVIDFPIATGEYYKVDYSPGTDISRWKNIPVPTSYMAYHSDYDFVGSYDHGRGAGLLHVANHHISPGKKQWTWGTGEFGQRWCEHLTDEDGPYIELMCGVYTDNQPDFAWLMPGEEKRFTQHFLPYKGLGMVTNATKDAALALHVERGQAHLRAYVTAPQPGARVVVRHGHATILDEPFEADPTRWFERTIDVGADTLPEQLTAAVLDGQGRPLVRDTPQPQKQTQIPEPATAIDTPASLDSPESLYLAGLHLEQYRHATRQPAAYYEHALKRDHDDLRCRNALGRLRYQRGQFAEAEAHFRAAYERHTRHNPNPYDGEPLYNLGLALRMQNRYEEAEAAFYKAAWNRAQQERAYFELARIALRRGQYESAQQRIACSLDANPAHHQAAHLQVTLAALSNHVEAAKRVAHDALQRDPFNTGVLYELSRFDTSQREAFDRHMADQQRAYIELAIDYRHAGLQDRAIDVLEHLLTRLDGDPQSPMPLYYLADSYRGLGEADAADQYLGRAAARSPHLCFPNRLEDIAVLDGAFQHAPGDWKAAYYLGNLWYGKKQHQQAIACWEQATRIEPGFPTAWRNLGFAYYNVRGEAQQAWTAYQNALAADPSDARVLYELDQLAKCLGHDVRSRRQRLDEHPALVEQRDDLYLEYVTLLNVLGEHQTALDTLLKRNFHPWEGGEGKVPAQYVLALLKLAEQAMQAGDYATALTRVERAEHWPKSLGEGKLATVEESNIHYFKGLAYRGMGDEARARACFEAGGTGQTEPASPMYYNDTPPDMIYYQGLCQQALGEEAAARLRFQSLVEHGQQHIQQDLTLIDYFAVSLPDFLLFEEDLNQRNEAHCRYVMALGYLGLQRYAAAAEQFSALLASNPAHVGASAHHAAASFSENA
jgi:tetratricopeptide (TPR) repeat protein